MFWKREAGNKGEELAVQFLKRKKLKIIERSYQVKAGEIDIIAKERQTYCFIEVKSRSSDKFGKAIEAIDHKKRIRITRAALWYLQSKHLTESPCRFDVVAIQYPEDGQPPEIQWIQNAFEMDERYRY